MSRERWMALCFAIGSVCFLIGPIGVYARLVGNSADAVTYFVGSIPFTLGGAIQTISAWIDRGSAADGWVLARSAAIQSVGTIFFNLTTWRALSHAPAGHHYDVLVWRPDAIGSAAFLISGAMAYAMSPRRGWRPAVDGPGWWEPALNLLGCALFALSAIGAVAISGSLVGPRLDSWGTALGAACFLGCALGTLISARTFKSPRLRRWERTLERDLDRYVELG